MSDNSHKAESIPSARHQTTRANMRHLFAQSKMGKSMRIAISASRSKISWYIDRLEKKIPRIFNIFFKIVLPYLLLMCLAMILGHFLVVLEREGEIKDLQIKVGSYLRESQTIDRVATSIQESYDKCLEDFVKYNSTKSDLSDLTTTIQNCAKSGIQESQDLREEIHESNKESLIGSDISSDSDLTFNWNICGDKNGDGAERNFLQAKAFLENYAMDWFTFYDDSVNDTKLSEAEAADFATENARVTQSLCKANSSSGAFFWFTIMTTIGYGNTAPVTNEGRCLVFAFGILSILAFGLWTRSAAYVSLSIIDDLLARRLKKPKMMKGWPSVVFWFCIALLLLVVTGLAFYLYGRSKYVSWDWVTDFRNCLWFAYITLTTIGFGDYHPRHDMMLYGDVMYCSFIIMIGYVSVANFILKLSEVLSEMVKNSTDIADGESLAYILNSEFDLKSSGGDDMEEGQAINFYHHDHERTIGKDERIKTVRISSLTSHRYVKEEGDVDSYFSDMYQERAVISETIDDLNFSFGMADLDGKVTEQSIKDEENNSTYVTVKESDDCHTASKTGIMSNHMLDVIERKSDFSC